MEFEKLLCLMVEKGGFDLFIIVGVLLLMKVNGWVMLVIKMLLLLEQICEIVLGVMNEQQCCDFVENYECNFVISVCGIGCFWVSVFYQCNLVGMVLCWIEINILILEELKFLEIFKKLVLIKCGLVIFVGVIGIGKFILLVVMIGYCNKNFIGYIIFIEDLIEYIYQYQGCIVIQCEVGLDIDFFEVVLKNILCQVLDVIMIGEVCLWEIMDYVVVFVEIGYLCLVILYVNNVNQVLEWIIYFFLVDCYGQVWMDLLLNFKVIVVQ